MLLPTRAAATLFISFAMATVTLGAPISPPATPATPSADATPGADATMEPGKGLIDDSDPAWVWSGMSAYSDKSLHGGTAHAGGPGTAATYSFHGTAVDVVGFAGPSIHIGDQVHGMGNALVFVDSKQVSLASLSASTPQYDYVIAHVTGLSNANHVVRIEAQDGWVVVDYIRTVDPGTPSGFMLINVGSGLAMDVSATGTPAGAHLQLVKPSGAVMSQVWTLKQNADGYWSLLNTANQLTVSAHLDQTVTWALLTPETDRPDSEWRVDKTANGAMILTNRQTGYCLSVFQSSNQSGSWLDLDTVHPDDPVQEWSIREPG